MNPVGKLLPYFYAFVLFLWSIAIPYGEQSFIPFTLDGQETISEKVDCIGQPKNDLFLSTSLKIFTSFHPVDHLSHLSHIFYEKAFQFKYLKALFTTTLSFLDGIDIEFKFIDGIFPFHFFW